MEVPSLFERFLFEAPGDDPPDVPDDAATQEGPPDMGLPDDSSMGGDMPDMGGMDSMGSDDSGGDDMGGFMDDQQDDSGEGDNGQEDLQLSDKVNAIMNQQLYQRFLALLNTIGSQLTMMKNNSDMLYTLSPESLDNIESLKKLDENVRLYLKNSFLQENYSKNLLFFNKCLNLLKLLNSIFDGNVRKGIKNAE